ncbi:MULTISPECIES: tyrosine--tRNA ligase [Turicibacter]|jgi:tyrosine--tRNA ligase|uniref:Tyrosine--tRNA ligase n=6 Tax=Turicibacter sanguinis TaxID=154288 RepID=A0A173T7B3_9FIRM|nr:MULTISPECIES: tyrosine--tRNA ligase [Turicibacter]EFF63113.1 tyrosine--tRNA ligase [Turicibacter sanguinis PC909]EGC91726.1 tyrosine--tRNA ligase [Turicibacter sp. HGF1]MBP3904192.1 tyrosine--tRNA ligase [Turicibacter sp.]MCU7190977.1 tyrosine--tRNA ligase [Turicibacter sanguinis]MCU7197114.1 tyrosine--tRNA ligase [Turicibacter sanguinis]
MKNEFLKDLQWRGLINDCTDFDALDELVEKGNITLYCGFDPTADSLHIGHLLMILILKRFQLAGHKPLALVGGATGLIGDPSGRSVERPDSNLETVEKWSNSIKGQLSQFLDFNETEANGAEIVNNYDWTSNVNMLDFLRDVGKYFNVNYILAKDLVCSRLDKGMTFTEFSYTILQGMDFKHLYETKKCVLQIGGSDQWGNITSGLELIRKQLGHEEKAVGLTMPLVTKADGTKFGKTAGGAVWLDRKKTSPYELYQFLINTADEDVVKFLKYFTFLTKEEIEAVEAEFKEAPHLRHGQKVLAREVVTLVHGVEAYEQALKITEALFSGNLAGLTAEEIEVGFKDVPSVELAEDLNLVDALVFAKAASSKRESREFINNNSILINGEKVNNLEFIVSKENAIGGKFTVIRRGKKKYFLIKHV